MNMINAGAALFMYLGIASLSFFAFLAVASWSNSRRQEREAFYRGETLKKIVEAQGAGSPVAIEFLREEERIKRQRRREGLKLGGLITLAVGIGLMIFLRAIERADPVFLVGLIPLLIGVVLTVYGYSSASKT